MTGAAIVRWDSAEAVVLAVHGAFDGSSAWALRNDMDESPAVSFVVDLTHAVEACDFAASLLATWARARRQTKRISFRAGSPEHAALLAAHGLEVLDDETAEALTLPLGFPMPHTPAASGAPV
jgi:hypothetical protein